MKTGRGFQEAGTNCGRGSRKAGKLRPERWLLRWRRGRTGSHRLSRGGGRGRMRRERGGGCAGLVRTLVGKRRQVVT